MGTVKTFVSWALGEQACRQGYRVLYGCVPRQLEELAVARADGTYARVQTRLLRNDLLILGDRGIGSLIGTNSRDLWELLEDRCDQRATIGTSQLSSSADMGGSVNRRRPRHPR